jgi:hypothetical protein
MKYIILLSASLAFFSSTFACSCSSGQSFCNTHSRYSITASCVVVNTFSHGVSVKVINLLNGNENRDTITIWDIGGPYNMCNDSLEFASAAYLVGSIGDTVILALPLIDSVINSWDVIGDYRTPGFQCDEYRLFVKNNVVYGFISGWKFCNNDCLRYYDYNDFISDFPAKRLNCETWLAIDDFSSNNILTFYPNPTSSVITIKTAERGTISVMNDLGQIIDSFFVFYNEQQILTDKLAKGIYTLTFQTKRAVVARKFIVQ